MTTEKITQMTNELVEVMSKPELVNLIKDFENQSTQGKSIFRKLITNTEELKKRGIILPKGIKLTTKKTPQSQLRPEGSVSICGNFGWVSICYTF